MVSQEQFINKILATGDYSLISENNLTKEYFFNYPAEFDFILNHFEKYHKVPDVATFSNAFPYFKIMKCDEPVNYLLENLQKDYNTAYLAERFNKIKSMLENGKTDEAVNYFKTSVDNLRVGGASHCTNLITDHSRWDAFLARSANRKNAFISTGFPELDNIIGGIDKSEEDMVIAARTGIGKSWVLCKIAAAASKQGICVGLYSGEMSADKVGYRIDTLLSEGIANSSITRGDMDPMMQMQYKRYLDSLPNQGYGAIKVLTPNDIAGPATVAALDAFVVREHIQLLLVDQYSLLEDTSRSTVMHERVANISKAIKNLQVMRKIPVVSVSQMNRTKNEDNEQDTTQIGLSDRIGQDATTIIMLSRNNPSPDGDYTQEQLILNIVKARDGGDGKKLTYKADFNHGQFTYIDVAANKEEAKKLRDEYEGEDE